jgi:ATP-dependent Clp protease, protease subunit
MSVKLKRDSLDWYLDYHMHLESRTVYIGDSTGTGPADIDSKTAELAIKALHLLSAQSSDKPIRIILNSFGGCVYSGFAIYDAIRSCPNYVTIEVLGSAMSIASIILQAADWRVVHPNATIMIHDGTDSVSDLPPRSIESQAEYGKIIRKRFYNIYASRSNKGMHFWDRCCSKDTYMTAEEAVENGLADIIYEPPERPKS